MNAIRTVVNMHTRGKWIWFFWPGMFLLIQLPITLIIALIIQPFTGKGSAYGGGLVTSVCSCFSREL